MESQEQFESLAQAAASMPVSVSGNTKNVVDWWGRTAPLLEKLRPRLYESQKNIFGLVHFQNSTDMTVLDQFDYMWKERLKFFRLTLQEPSDEFDGLDKSQC